MGLSIVLGAPAAAQQSGDGLSGRLYWKNGDLLPGRLADTEKSAAGARLGWKADLFEQALSLDSGYLDALLFDRDEQAEAAAKKAATTSSAPLFRLVTTSGDAIDGSLVAIDERQVRLRRAGYGQELVVEREAISELVRLDSTARLLYGIGDPQLWKGGSGQNNSSGWEVSADGRFQSKRWRSSVHRELITSKPFVIDIRLSSFDQRPEFAVGFDRKGEHFRVETWEDEVVLTAGDHFEPILTLAGNDRDLRLLIGVDFAAKAVSVFSASGEQLGRMDFSHLEGKWDPGDLAIYLKNKGANLELSRLSVARWSGDVGNLPADGVSVADAAGPRPHRLCLNDGSTLAGRVVSYETGGGLVFSGAGSSGPMSLDDIASITLATASIAPARNAEPDVDHLSYFDGQRIRGDLQHIDGESLTLLTPLSAQPIRLALSGARQLRFREGEAAKDSSTEDEKLDGDHLLTGERHLRGRLVSGEEVGAMFGWQSEGADRAVALRPGSQARIVRGAMPGEGEAAWSQQTLASTDRLVLRSREIVSCRVTAIDAETVHFEDAIVAARQVPIALLNAVEFAGAGPVSGGFADPRWKVLSEAPDSATLIKNSVKLVAAKSGRVSHGSLLAGNEVRFKLGFGENGRGGALRLGLFGGGGDDGESGLEFTILGSGNRVWVTKVERGKPFSFSNNGLQGIDKWPLPVRLNLSEDTVQIYVDDRLAMTRKIDPDVRRGHALTVSTDPMSTRYGGADSVVVVEDLVVLREKGTHVPHRVSAEAQREALTVPRFRRKNPQAHVLIAGNGDLLRGHLVAVDEEQVTFTSRLEEIVIPRDRVAAAVWLQPLPEEEGDSSEADKDGEKPEQAPADEAHSTGEDREGELEIVLNDGARLRLVPGEMEDGFLMGRSLHLGDCRIPLESIRELRSDGDGEGGQDANATMTASAFYADWQLLAAVEPDIPSAGDDGAAPGSGAGADPGSGGRPGMASGDAAEAFSLPLLGDEAGDFDLAEAKGSIVVLDFWATWCGPCIRAIPDYQEALEGFDADKVRFVGINQGEAPAVIKKFMAGRDWDFTVALDQNGKVAESYGVTGIPHTVVVDAEGKVAWIHTGYTPEGGDELKKVIESLLEKSE